MANLVRQQELDVEVAYRGFCFQESDDSAVPVPFNDGYEWGVFLNPHARRIDLFSAGHTHTATVTVKVWDAEPPLDTSVQWDEQGEVDFESTTGEVAVWTLTLGRAKDVISLAESGGQWRVRVYCSGRAEVERVTRIEGVAHGVEKYLLEFWPQDA
ncbi:MULTISPECIES: hypothetical protein [Streptomyces]|uniref:hypothetical protein n=1 Tax=Streptomyces TaxID=1883 RepID=UPI001675B33E|nr:hypothetical protein [Streptomyces violascens]